MAKIRNIAIYGKGGIGKFTTVSIINAALSEEDYRAMQSGNTVVNLSNCEKASAK